MHGNFNFVGVYDLKDLLYAGKIGLGRSKCRYNGMAATVVDVVKQLQHMHSFLIGMVIQELGHPVISFHFTPRSHCQVIHGGIAFEIYLPV